MPITLKAKPSLYDKYRNPLYLETAAKRKFGEDIFVLGATFNELQKFWDLVQQSALSIGPPYEVGRTVVDIDSKCHNNTSKSCTEPDDFKITSTTETEQQKTTSTSYQLQLSKEKRSQVGGNLHFKIGGPAFFNVASGGLTAGASKEFVNKESSTFSKGVTHSQKLSESYKIVEELKVPALTKVRAVITTWAVTYEADTEVKLAIDAKAIIPIRYRSKNSQKYLAGLVISEDTITAAELFEGEDNYDTTDDILTFTRKGKLSYLSEEVEITKEEKPLENMDRKQHAV